MTRRKFLYGSAALGGIALLAPALLRWSGPGPASAATQEQFAVMKTEAEWRAALSDMQYRVLREEGTERAFTSPLNDEKRTGMFHCAGCDNAVYSSETKFDSGTGWPSFWEAEANGIGTKVDNTLFMTRTECHCARCGGHLGHIFDDGPQPTGKRHCINGVVMIFMPGAAAG